MSGTHHFSQQSGEQRHDKTDYSEYKGIGNGFGDHGIQIPCLGYPCRSVVAEQTCHIDTRRHGHDAHDLFDKSPQDAFYEAACEDNQYKQINPGHYWLFGSNSFGTHGASVSPWKNIWISATPNPGIPRGVTDHS